MKIDHQLLEKTAKLARLELKDEDIPQLLESMNQILNWVEKLHELDTTEVEPLLHLIDETNTVRPDIAQNLLTREEGLANAPQKKSEFFVVPKVIEN